MLALLTHTVLTLDWGISGVETHVGIRLQDLDWRWEATQAGAEALPTQSAALASSPKRWKPPHAQHIVAVRFQSCPVARDRVIWEVPPHHLSEPLPSHLRRYMQALPQLRPYIFELGCHALADRLAMHRELARLMAGPTDVSEV